MGTYYNQSGDSYVSWNWKLNGGTTSTETAGTIDTTVQVDADRGISIMQYVGDGGSSDWNLAHGLGASPEFLIRKDRDTNSNNNQWGAWHIGMGFGQYMYLSDTAASAASTKSTVESVTSTLFNFSRSSTTGGDLTWGESGDNYVNWAFVSKEGFSRFSSYEGNGNANGTYVYTGFRPAYVIIKRIDSTGSWHIFDEARNTYNAADTYLLADTTAADDTASSNAIDLLSNGFKLRNVAAGLNASDAYYIFAAFAENPLKYAVAR
tara:strand:- start:88 stop:879 length:792 start_codon:yes stop_codon:yes gene_type:complete